MGAGDVDLNLVKFKSLKISDPMMCADARLYYHICENIL